MLFEVGHYGQIPEFRGEKSGTNLNHNIENRTRESNVIPSAKDMTTLTEREDKKVNPNAKGITVVTRGRQKPEMPQTWALCKYLSS